MNSMVPGTHMGRLLCPKPSLFNYFVGISTFPGKLQVAPASLAYFPLWGPAAVAEGLRIRRTPQGVQGVSNSRLQNPQDHRVSTGSPPAAGPSLKGIPKRFQNDPKIRPRKRSTFELQTVPQRTPKETPKSSKSMCGGLQKGVLEKVSKQ